MKNKHIPQTELQKLASNTMRTISLHSLGQWVKSQTDNSYIVIPRVLATSLIDNVKLTSSTKSSQAILIKWSTEEMDIWL